jgi:hypothetical protein
MSLAQYNTYQNQVLLFGGMTGGSIIGPQGTQGVQGVQGFLGNLGNQGFQGTIGPLGNQGHQGWQGFQGEFGIQGGEGFQGRQGDAGLQGFQGIDASGLQGNQGLQGIIGGSITTTNYSPSLVSGANLTAQAGAIGAYATIGSKKFAWGSGTWRWANSSQTGGGIGNTPSISFPSGHFTTVQQFILSVSEVGGEAIQLVNGDLSGSNTVGNFWAWRPVASGSGATYFFTMSFLAIGV